MSLAKILLLLCRFLTLCKDVRLNISVVVLACPHKGSGRLEHLGDHVINKPVLIPDLQFVKLGLVVPEGRANMIKLCTDRHAKKIVALFLIIT